MNQGLILIQSEGYIVVTFHKRPGVVAQACNPGRKSVQGQPRLHSTKTLSQNKNKNRYSHKSFYY